MSVIRQALPRGALLAGVSFAVLAQELTLIRWLPVQVRVLAYFPNLVLLSAFLGLGVGCLRAAARPMTWVWPWALLLVTAAGAGMSGVAFTHESPTEHLFLLYYDLPRTAPVIDDIRMPVLASFLLAALSFVPAGQLVARLLASFREAGRPLQGYAFDIGGSLLGVAGFTLLSFLGARPLAWFALVLSAAVLLAGERRWAAAVGAAAVLLVVQASDRAAVYSPYYGISTAKSPKGTLDVLVNGSLHQVARPMDRATVLADRAEERVREGYHLPYRLLARPPRRALVIGAGTGNDVAVLLDEGAEHVTAVEIDPVILALGRTAHPSRPYLSPRVSVVNADARAFLERTPDRYDLIVFGTLDSMTRLSALSNVRLDEFVYTKECLRAARARLTADGGLALYYMAGMTFIDLRLMGMVASVFEEAPIVSTSHYYTFNRIYMAGPAFAHVNGAGRRASASGLLRDIGRAVELPSDDWPYLYLRGRALSPFQMGMIALLGGVAVGLVALASAEMRSRLMRRERPDVPLFLFGLAFLLLETRAVTQMNLAWGATWLTSAVVFSSILAMVLAATLLAQWRPWPVDLSIPLLILCLVGAWLLPTRWLVQGPFAVRLMVSVTFVGLPVFFASMAFAELFRGRADSAASFGWNLLGAVAGGLLESASVVLGLRDLLLVAALAYALAWFLERRARAGEAAAEPSLTSGEAGV